jgi:RHS repeat-associated protein
LTFNEYQKESGVANLFQYNGKEKQDELDLNWMDYGARMYMPELGKWLTSDPLTEIAPGISPYAYCYNNPVNYVDPTGMFGEEDEQGRKRFDSFTDMYIAPMDRTEGLNDTDRANRDATRQREGRDREVTNDDIAASYKTQEYGTDVYSGGQLLSHTVEGYYLVPSSAQQGQPAVRRESNHWFGDKLDVHVESTFKEYEDMTIITHNVLIVQHDTDNNFTDKHQFAIGTIILPDRSEVWGYGNAKFSEAFLDQTKTLYELRQKLFYPQSVGEKWRDFSFSFPEEHKNKLHSGAPYR